MDEQKEALPLSTEDLIGHIEELEKRVSRLESELNVVKTGRPRYEESEDQVQFPRLDFSGLSIESKFGEFGLAWLGNFVLLFGIIFFIQFLQRSGFSLLSSILGYFAVAGLFIVSRLIRHSHENLASIFRLNGYILLFVVTFFLHFMATEPLVSSKAAEIVLLLGVSLFQFIVALRKKSQGFAGLAVLMSIVTAVISDSTHVMLAVTVLISAITVFFLHRYGWWRLLVFSIIVVYLVNLMWFIGNPIMGHPVEALKVHQYGFIYLFLIAAIYSMIGIVPQRGLFPDNSAITSIILNGLGFSFMVALYTLSFFKDNYIMMYGSIALFCLVYSVILQARTHWKVTASLYALYSFVALSVTIYGLYSLPRSFALLAVQSLLVVSMALWFRSRVIVIMNTVLFTIILITYLSTSASVNSINITFALTPLVTARILKWQRERLNIKTELLRNVSP